MLCLSTRKITMLLLFATVWSTQQLALGAYSAEAEDLRALEGEWLYVEDRTEGRPAEEQGPPMSMKFKLRVEEDAVFMLRGSRPEQRLALDGSTVEVAKETSITRYTSEWKDGTLVFKTEIVRKADESRIAMVRMEFSPSAEGLLVRVPVNGINQVSLYQHPEDIELPKPATAKIDEIAWLAGTWIGSGNVSTEERWGPAAGGSMLGTSRTIKKGKMVGFEYLRIVERESGLVYVAQPGGKSPTEFPLVKLNGSRAVFENPRHDFPQRITYELSADGQLSASIGFTNGGRPRTFVFAREVNK